MKLKLFAMIALFLSSAAHADEGLVAASYAEEGQACAVWRRRGSPRAF